MQTLCIPWYLFTGSLCLSVSCLSAVVVSFTAPDYLFNNGCVFVCMYLYEMNKVLLELSCVPFFALCLFGLYYNHTSTSRSHPYTFTLKYSQLKQYLKNMTGKYDLSFSCSTCYHCGPKLTYLGLNHLSFSYFPLANLFCILSLFISFFPCRIACTSLLCCLTPSATTNSSLTLPSFSSSTRKTCLLKKSRNRPWVSVSQNTRVRKLTDAQIIIVLLGYLLISWCNTHQSWLENLAK